jgi:cysteine sulfinate desulfinase/cysteine desulfurase-like protein
MTDERIYLDFNASTPIAPEVVEAMRPFLAEHYGNSSSQHWAGAPAKEAVELSPVLAAMGVPKREGMGAVRFSLGRTTTWVELEHVLGLLRQAARGR